MTTESDAAKALRDEIVLVIIDKLVGQPIYYSDTLCDLVARHCPEVYDIARERGFVFVADDRKEPLMKLPPELNFEIVKDEMLH